MAKEEKSKFRRKLRWFLDHLMAVISIILVVIVFGGAYYFVIAPNMVAKPFIPNPGLPKDALSRINAGEEVINSSHINYLINEIGAYKLKKLFGTKKYPIMEFVLTDINQRYYAYVKDHIPITKKGNAKDEDIVMEGSQETVVEILEDVDLVGEVRNAKDDGRIKVDLVASMKTLASKGYLSLYDTLK